MPLRLIFMGTPDFAVPTLLQLAAHGHEIAAVYTREAKPSGRGMKLQPTPVAREAERLGQEPRGLLDRLVPVGEGGERLAEPVVEVVGDVRGDPDEERGAQQDEQADDRPQEQSPARLRAEGHGHLCLGLRSVRPLPADARHRVSISMTPPATP